MKPNILRVRYYRSWFIWYKFRPEEDKATSVVTSSTQSRSDPKLSSFSGHYGSSEWKMTANSSWWSQKPLFTLPLTRSFFSCSVIRLRAVNLTLSVYKVDHCKLLVRDSVHRPPQRKMLTENSPPAWYLLNNIQYTFVPFPHSPQHPQTHPLSKVFRSIWKSSSRTILSSLIPGIPMFHRLASTMSLTVCLASLEEYWVSFTWAKEIWIWGQALFYLLKVTNWHVLRKVPINCNMNKNG